MPEDWEKFGLVIRPSPKRRWMKTHAMLPTARWLRGDVYRVYFSGRDERNRSLVGYADLDLNEPAKPIAYSKKPVLGLGELGCFDDNGVTPSWLVEDSGRLYLYYIGWQPRTRVRMSLVAGLAASGDGGETFERVQRVPVLERTPDEPFLLNTAPCVLKEGDLWRMWYVSGVEWVHPDLPRYNIKYAESGDGVRWRREGRVCIDFASPQETALARPCVLKQGGKYRMWFSFKATEDDAYRLGYAESDDGLSWSRLDHLAGISRSGSGPDSEMVCYAFVFEHKGRRYMLYNGNGYGKEGVLLAAER